MGMYGGGVILALWSYVRFSNLRPATLRGAVAHVAVSMVAFRLVPLLLDLCGHVIPGPLALVVAIAGVVAPALCYVYLSWLWLIARISENLSRGPRGGHPVHAGTR